MKYLPNCPNFKKPSLPWKSRGYAPGGLLSSAIALSSHRPCGNIDITFFIRHVTIVSCDHCGWWPFRMSHHPITFSGNRPRGSWNIIRPWDQTNLVLNSIEKVKPGSLLSLMCMFPESNGTKFWSHSFHLQNSGILQTRMDQRGDPMKTNFDIFQNKNEYQKQLDLKK